MASSARGEMPTEVVEALAARGAIIALNVQGFVRVMRSGRGDTCTAAYLSRRLAASPAEAVTWAAAVTSLKWEEEGPFNRELAEVEALYEKLSAR